MSLIAYISEKTRFIWLQRRQDEHFFSKLSLGGMVTVTPSNKF